jgi:transposase-like protein
VSGHLTTVVEEGMSSGRLRRYREEFKATVDAAGQGTGGSVAAVELDCRLKTDLLRRWIDQAEAGSRWGRGTLPQTCNGQ